MHKTTMQEFIDYYGPYRYPCGEPYSRYEVNIYGDVYDKVTNQWITETRGPNTPYTSVSLVKDGHRKTQTVNIHRLLAKVFLKNDTGLEFDQCQVDHLDGDKLNNDLSNLEIVTQQENKARAYKTGLRQDNKYIELTNVKTHKKKVFYSQAEASRYLNINPSSLCEILNKYNGVLQDYHGYTVRRIQ